VKRLTMKRRILLERWLNTMGQWLWNEQVTGRQAAAYAEADGLDFVTPLRIVRFANKRDDAPDLWPARVPIYRQTMLDAKEWDRLNGWALRNRALLPALGSMRAVITVAAHAGQQYAPAAVREAVKAVGLELPEHSPRPSWAG
jgi:hypothetical protein